MKIVPPEIVQYVDSGHGCAHGCCSSGALGGSVQSRHGCEAEAREDTAVPGSSHYSVFAGVLAYCCSCPASMHLELPRFFKDFTTATSCNCLLASAMACFMIVEESGPLWPCKLSLLYELAGSNDKGI